MRPRYRAEKGVISVDDFDLLAVSDCSLLTRLATWRVYELVQAGELPQIRVENRVQFTRAHLRSRRDFARLTVAAGVPKIRFHDLRHKSASLLLAANVNPKVVSERLGHSSNGVTLDIYSHVLPTMQREVANALGKVLSADAVR
jgi:integrase